MQMDETLSSVADKIKNFAVIYLVDITEVPDFNAMYELYDPCTVMFFFRNKVCHVLWFGMIGTQRNYLHSLSVSIKAVPLQQRCFPTILLVAHCLVRLSKARVENMPHCNVLL